MQWRCYIREKTGGGDGNILNLSVGLADTHFQSTLDEVKEEEGSIRRSTRLATEGGYRRER
jgi:hypothetical protein